MTTTPHQPDMQSTLRKAVIARGVRIGIDPKSVWCPSPRGLVARRHDGRPPWLDVSRRQAADLAG